MLGNKIAQRVFVDRNLPQASALSALLIAGRPAADGRGSGAAGAEAPRGRHRRGGRVRRSRFPLAVTSLLLAFFYLPIVVLVVNSFNASRFGGGFEGSTLDWYRRLFEHREIWPALAQHAWSSPSARPRSRSCSAPPPRFALHRYRSRLQRLHYVLIYTPLVVPEILMGISLLLFFAAVGLELGLFIDLPRPRHLLPELRRHGRARAAAGLRRLGGGGRPRPGRRLVDDHLAHPAAAARARASRPAALLAFTLSIDDFVITFFVAGPGSDHAADPHLQHDQARVAAAHQRPLHAAAGGDLRRGLAQPAPHRPAEKP